jgi:nascent polypeptide-associated complex subunit alpha
MMPGFGSDPKQMAQMMRRFGIDVREIDDVQEVVVRTPAKDYVFTKATVSVMKAQGVETWQVSGKPKVVEKAGAAGAAGTSAKAKEGTVLPPNSSPSATVAAPSAAQVPVPAEEPADYEPAGEDVALVARETGKTAAAARQALVEANGDLAEAILRLQA